MIKIEIMEMHITSCEMMSSSLGCRKAFCQTGCISDGQITRDRFNNALPDEWPSSNRKYLSDLVLPMLLTTKKIRLENNFSVVFYTEKRPFSVALFGQLFQPSFLFD